MNQEERRNGKVFLSDSHIHSTHSPDARTSIIEVCQSAVEMGLAYICFTEHLDLDPRDSGYRYFEPEAFFREVDAARTRFRGRLTIGAGIEVCYQTGREDEIARWLERWPFDFVLGSVHILDGEHDWVMVPEQASMAAWARHRTPQEAYRPYFEEVRRAAATGLFDGLAHLDLVKRYGTLAYGPFDASALAEEIDAVLAAAVATDTAIEINTSGLFQPPQEPFPGLDILRRYRQMGGRAITIGSDTHHLYQLGRGLETARQQAIAAGFTHVAYFLERQPRFAPLSPAKSREVTP